VDRPLPIGENQWHLLGGPENSEAPLKIRQHVWVYDAHLSKGRALAVPTISELSPWLYVIAGAAQIGTQHLVKGDAVSDLDQTALSVESESNTTLVLFLVDRAAPASRDGTVGGG
jgi:hypothetical protein